MFAFASFARDSTRAAFALGNSCCETLSFLAKHSWVLRGLLGRCRAVPGVPACLPAGLPACRLPGLSSLFSLSCLGVSLATFGLDLSSLLFLNLFKGGNARRFFLGVSVLVFDLSANLSFSRGRRLATFSLYHPLTSQLGESLPFCIS